MLKVTGYANVHNISTNEKETVIFATLRSSDKVEGEKNPDGTQKYDTNFINAVFVGNACKYGLEILKEKMFINVTSSKLIQDRWEDKQGQTRQTYKLLVFEFEEVQTKKKESSKRKFK